MTPAEFDRAFPTTSPTESDRQFDRWMDIVNCALVARTGLDSNDLPDFCYRDAFDDGATPKQAAVAAIHAAKDY